MAFIYSLIKRGACLRNIACGLALAGMAFTGGSLQAASCDTGVNVGNLIKNCGFETLLQTNWTRLNNVNVFTSSPLAPNGDTSYVMLNISKSGDISALTQTISGLVSNTTYNVSFQFLTGLSTGASYAILDANNFSVAGGNVPISGPGNWSSKAFQFSTASNTTYSIRFQFTQQDIIGQFGIDNVIVTPVVVPEPASMLLLGSLCSAVVGYKFKRKVS